MKTLLPIIVSELQANRSVALATVLQNKGSAPRGAGACQLLLQDGHRVGTVGGGKLEHRALAELHALLTHMDAAVLPIVTQTAPNMLAIQNGSLSQEYALTQDDVQSLGMVCGGNVSLVYQLLTVPMLPFWEAMLAHLRAQQNVWLVRHLIHGRVDTMSMSDGSQPLAIACDLMQAPYARKPQLLSYQADQTCFVEPISLVSHTYLFGGGHVAQCVAPLLAKLDFAPVVVDDRLEFADPALFPGVGDVICAPFSQAISQLTITPEDEIVIMTRGHVNDWEILSHSLHTPAYYIGLIGSRSKIAHTRAMLLENGFTQDDFARIHTPIGLPILAETPMEIAVSVAAEMIRCRAERALAEDTIHR